MSTDLETGKEARIALAIRRHLDESSRVVPAAAAERLRAARERALAMQKREPAGVAALAGGRGSVGVTWFWRLGPIAVLVGGLIGINLWHAAQLSDEILDIDTRLLVDEIPPNAYLDKGFGAWLARQGQ
jgi:hypothetical protein